MSMHKIPLTLLESTGLQAHGLKIGEPSQLSDAFRQGVRWSNRNVEVQKRMTPHDVFHNDRIMSLNAEMQLPLAQIVELVQAVEDWHLSKQAGEQHEPNNT